VVVAARVAVEVVVVEVEVVVVVVVVVVAATFVAAVLASGALSSGCSCAPVLATAGDERARASSAAAIGAGKRIRRE